MPAAFLSRYEPAELQDLQQEERRLHRVFFGALFLHFLLVMFLYLVRPRLLYVLVFFQDIMLWTMVVIVYAFQRLHYASSAAKAILREEGLRDQTTGVFNCRYPDVRLTEERRRTGRYGASTSVLYVDLDEFKPVNDRFVHQTGNQVLREVAGAMDGAMRSCDVLGRVGGDEFLAVLPQTNRHEARKVAERLRKAVENYVLDLGDIGKVDRVRANIGLAGFPANGDTLDEVLTAADSALYSAKEEGGNQVCVSERHVHDESRVPEPIEGLRTSDARV